MADGWGWHAASMLALLLASAGAGQAAGLHAAKASLAGVGTLDADLVGIVLDEAQSASGLALAVTQGQLVLDEERTALWAATFGITPSEHRRQPYDLVDASVGAFAFERDIRILVLPGKAARVTGAIQDAAFTHATQAERFSPRASIERPALQMGSAGAVQAAAGPATSSSLVIEGAFTLAVWAATFQVVDATGVRTVATGAHTAPYAGGDDHAGERVQREAFVDVTQGRLVVPFDPHLRVYLANARLLVQDGWLQVHEPQGGFGFADAPRGSRLLQLPAPVQAALATASDGPAPGLAVGLGEAPRAAILDGQPMAPAPVVGYAVLFALCGASAASAAAFGLARWRARLRRRRLDALLADRRFDEAFLVAAAVARDRRHREEAALAQAVCRINQGRYGQAKEILEAQRTWTATSAAVRHYLLANAEAGVGRTKAAAQSLVQCLLLAPAFAAEALVNPRLAAVVESSLAATPDGRESYA